MSTHQQPGYAPQGIYPGQQTTHAPSPMTPGPSAQPGSTGIPMQGTVQDPLSQHLALGATPAAGYGQAAYTYAPAPVASSSFLGLNFQDQQFWKGAILGAGITLLLTNDTIQKGLIKSTAKIYGAVQGGVQEIKEKFEDVQAEMRHKESKE